MFTSHTVTDNHDLVQEGLIVLQHNLHVGSSLGSGILITDVTDYDVSTCICFQREVTIEVRNGSSLRVRYTYGGTDDRFTLSILNMAFHVDLREGSYR